MKPIPGNQLKCPYSQNLTTYKLMHSSWTPEVYHSTCKYKRAETDRAQFIGSQIRTSFVRLQYREGIHCTRQSNKIRSSSTVYYSDYYLMSCRVDVSA